MAYSGAIYQLCSNYKLYTGAYVAVNGPYDTYGTVLCSVLQSDGRYLNRIRGTKPKLGERPIANF